MAQPSVIAMLTIDEAIKLFPHGRRVRFLGTEQVRTRVPAGVNEGVIREVINISGREYLILVEYDGPDGGTLVYPFEACDIEVLPAP